MTTNNTNNDTKKDKTFTWCGVDLFTWEEWDPMETDELVFYDCKWYDKGINKLLDQFYMGHPEISKDKRTTDVCVRLNGHICVDAIGATDPKTKIVETCTLFDGWATDLPSVHSYLGREGDMLDIWF